jgi:hypothetical protein
MSLLGGLGLAWALLYLVVNRLVPVTDLPDCLESRLRRTCLAARLMAGVCSVVLVLGLLND